MSLKRSGILKDGRFAVGIHSPEFSVKNFRENDYPAVLGFQEDGTPVENQANFPDSDLHEPHADVIYEIPNAFPFRGTTYINSAWADVKAADIKTISIAPKGPCSLIENLKKAGDIGNIKEDDPVKIIDLLPHPLLIAMAQASTDPEELIVLAKKIVQDHVQPKDRTAHGNRV